MKMKYKCCSILLALSLGIFISSCSSGDSGGMEEPDVPSQGDGSGDDNGGNSGSEGDNSGSEGEGTGSETTAWNLIFEDEFDGSSLEPNQQYWSLCEKGDKSWNRYLSESYDQAYQQDGYLHLIAEQVDGEYQTGGIETRGRFDFMYGKVECRAKFELHPQGNHTGIWMMPEPPAEEWPKSGEIDIMEHLNSDNIVYQTIHSWYLDDMDKKDPTGQGTAEIDENEWNTYGIIWDESSITFTINGENYMSYPNLRLSGEEGEFQWPFNHDFYIILSQSLGGEGTWAGEIDNAELPAEFLIDWVKVYQKQ